MLKKKKNSFVIFGQGRSGSTLLKELLNSHPEITCEGELFNTKEKYIKNSFMLRLIQKFPLAYFKYRRFISRSPVYGFTLLQYQASDPRKILSKLQDAGWEIIHISRNNLLNQCMSQLIANKTNLWHRREEQADAETTVQITLQEMITELINWNSGKIRERKNLKGITTVKVVYEDDLFDKNNWEQTTARIFKQLGTYPSSVQSSLQKTHNRHYSEIIENYDELIDKVKELNLLTIQDVFN